MLSIFKTNQPLANVILLVYLLVLRASTFIHPLAISLRPNGLLTDWMFLELGSSSAWSYFAAFVLVFIQAVSINLLLSRFRLDNDVTLLPGMFYCLITSLFPDFLTLSSILLANTFLIFSMFSVFGIYKNEKTSTGIFDAGLWLGVACLFDFSYVLFMFWGFVGLGILRGIRLNEFLMYIIGFFVTFFLFGVYLFWIDKLPLLANHFFSNYSFLKVQIQPSLPLYLKLGIMGALLLLVLLMSGQFFSRKTINAQKYVSLVYWLLIFSGLTILIQSGLEVTRMLVIALPLAVLISMAFKKIGSGTAEALHMLLLGIALIFQFEYLLKS
jgi:hypothetical protein